MAATTFTSPGYGTQIASGENRSVITLSETNQLKARSGRLCKLLVHAPGTTWVIDIYDNASANSNPVWQYVSADGKVALNLDVPLQNGLRVVTSGATPGIAAVVWT